MISIIGASKTYGKGENLFYALKNINIEINEKELVVILGASGSGKSTLLNLIGGIDKVDSGVIISCDKKISKISDKELTKYRADNIGFVFQFYNLNPNLTVWENVEVVREISEYPLEIEEVLKSVGILEQKDKFPNELSGGQQQRVAIARALVKRPKLLLCDEPTGALDYKTSKEVLELLSYVNKEFDTTILIITHNGPIAQMADRVIKLRSGELISNEINTNKIDAKGVEW